MREGKLGPARNAPAAAASAAPGNPTCPKCESPMVQRNGKYGAFWGCTRYPECRGTRRTGE